MRKLSILPVTLGIVLVMFAASGCGGSEAVQGPSDVQEPTNQPEEPEPLDFSSIEGQWSGTATERSGIVFSIRMSLSASAKPGRVVGSVRYWEAQAPDFACLGSWIAERAEHPTFTVRERITEGQCPDGMVDLEFDEKAATLRYDFTPIGGFPQAAASGTLTRDG